MNEELAGAMSGQQLNDLVERLRAEKEESDKEDFDTGRAWGVAYATTASYAEFLSYERQSEVEGDEENDEDFKLPDLEEGGLYELLQRGEVADPDVFREGWLSGLLEVWREASAKVRIVRWRV